MCAKISKKAAIKKGTVRLAPAATPSKNTARKSTGVRSRADRAAESDYSDEDIERIDPDESASSNDEVEEDFLNLQENGDPSGSNESRSSNDSEEETPRRSVRKTLHANVEYTPRRSVREPLHSNVGYTPRRSIEISQASTTKSSVGDRSQQQSSIHLAPRRASTSYARPPTQNDSQSGPSRPGPSRYSQRQSSPSPRRRSRKQANPKRKDRAIKEIIKMQKSHNLLIPLAPFQRVVRETMLKFAPDFRIQLPALKALQEASEMYLVHIFEDSDLLVLHRNRITLAPKDMRLALQLRPRSDPGRP